MKIPYLWDYIFGFSVVPLQRIIQFWHYCLTWALLTPPLPLPYMGGELADALAKKRPHGLFKQLEYIYDQFHF